ncbi:DNA-binding transcriptional LysR family regulator [Ensifer adhaerens]|uniref:DNA-binding transcriptional LysR family regulator n=1 Tax=Ensifer adhaerens TaxID=106592 RepID=A0ACC5T4Z9_ENSAD|nr:DNA-binding transcriptional LysR family regulator [Ensifer adhaerens]
MELRQLSYFVAVAEELHFGRAAARGHIAQPALSCQIQSPEKERGVQLFHRSTPRVELTRAGAVYYDRCVRILGDVDLSAEMVRSAAGKVHFTFFTRGDGCGKSRMEGQVRRG